MIARREFIKMAGLGMVSCSFPQLFSCRSRTSAETPNIILIVADDLGYGELGCYGQKIIRTPNIDRLAEEGMKFTQFYAGSAVCAPSRCTLMTGKHTGHAYIRNNGRPKGREHKPDKGIFAGQNPIPSAEITIAELLKSRGYATAAIGKWGLGFVGSEGDPNNQGFDLFYGYNCQVHAHNHYPKFLWRNDQKEFIEGNSRTLTGKHYSQDLFIEEAKKFITANREQPFFLFLPFIIPHLSIQVPESTLSEYKGKIPEAPYKHTSYLQHPFPHAGYAAMITHMDKGIGVIARLLKQLNLDENTIILFASDNGPTYNRLGGSDSDFFRSAGPFRGYKGDLYEGGIRVPLIVRWPNRIPAQSETRHIAAFWDILPTLADITGAVTPDECDGISFLPLLLNSGNQEVHDYLYWEFVGYGGQQAVRMGKWKAIRTGLRKGNGDTAIQLYDLEKDPGEKHDTAKENPDIVARCRKIMETARVESDLFPFPEIYSKMVE